MQLRFILRGAAILATVGPLAAACAQGTDSVEGSAGSGGNTGAGGAGGTSGTMNVTVAAQSGTGTGTGGGSSATTGSTSTGTTTGVTVGVASSAAGGNQCDQYCNGCTCPSDECIMCCAQHGKVDTCGGGMCGCF